MTRPRGDSRKPFRVEVVEPRAGARWRVLHRCRTEAHALACLSRQDASGEHAGAVLRVRGPAGVVVAREDNSRREGAEEKHDEQ